MAHSLAGKLKEQGHNAGILREFVRECPIPTGTEKQGSLAAQTWIITRQIGEELDALNKYDILICDPSLIEIYAYTAWWMRKAPIAGSALRDISSSIFASWVGTYDYVFKLPLTSKPADDKFRSVDASWQQEIDMIIDELLAKYAIPYKEIAPGTNDKRVGEVFGTMFAKPIVQTNF